MDFPQLSEHWLTFWEGSLKGHEQTLFQ